VLMLIGSEVVTNTYANGRTGMVVPGLASQASDPPMQGMHMRISSSSSARPARSDIPFFSSSSANTFPLSMVTISSTSASNSQMVTTNSNRYKKLVSQFSKRADTASPFRPQKGTPITYSVMNKDTKTRSTSHELKGRRYRRYILEPTSTNNSVISRTFHLLDEGEEKIQLSERYKNITLILGNTGAGKSTFVQWIAGDNNKLIAKEVWAGTGQYLIEDGNRIGNSTLKSKTIFPELVVHSVTDTAFYDCPGFSDTRSSSMEIAITYFIKKVADYAERVKLIFVVNHSSVEKGVDRQDFLKLIRHATDFIQDIDRYRRSIAIMVTKVDNIYNKVGRNNFHLVSDGDVIKAIGSFLEEVQQELVERLGGVGVPDEQKIFYTQALKFVNTLLIKDGEQFLRIGIFRRPDEPGPLSNITLLQEGKRHIERIVNENLGFTATHDDDFGYTISDTSKVAVGALAVGINDNVSSYLLTIAARMQEHYNHSVLEMRSKLLSMSNIAAAVDADPVEAGIFIDSFNLGYTVTTNLMEEVANITTDQLAEKINKSLTILSIGGCDEAMLRIEQQGKYFAFLQVMSDSALGSRAWGDLLQPIAQYLSNSRREIQNNINDVSEKINVQVENNIYNIAKKVKEYYQSKMRYVVIQQLSDEIKFGHACIMNMTKEMEQLNTTQDLARKIPELISEDGPFKISRTINHISRHGKYLTFLQIISNKTLDTSSPSQLIIPLNETATYLKESQGWYEFLTNLYEKLSTYDVQKNRMKYNVAHIADWGQEGKLQGISITHHNFRQFMEKIKEFHVIGYNEVANIAADELRVEELKQVASLTLDGRLHALCQSNKLTIKGGYIRLSEVIVEIGNCKQNRTEIFALNKIFVDENLNKEGEKFKLVMIAPTWEVIGRRTINLSGADAPPHNPRKASDGEVDGRRGADGRPGLPGGPAGSFFGVGTTFLNGNMLNIMANGGNGGDGQDGGNGGSGRAGDSPIESIGHYNGNYKCDKLCVDGRAEVSFDCDYIYLVKKTSHSKTALNKIMLYGPPPPRLNYLFRYTKTIAIFGNNGEPGGNGGDGGRNGYGGKSGDVKLITLGNDLGISSINNNGREGTMGRGGEGGDGGRDGYSIWLKCTTIFGILSIYRRDYFELFKRFEEDRGYAQSGNNGRVGTDEANIHNPEPGAIIDNKTEIINDYKSYARENLHVAVGGRIRRHYLVQFFRELDTSRDIKRMYDVSGLVGEHRGLERQFRRLQKRDSVFFYQSLLDRINEYANNTDDNQRSLEHNKTLAYMYTAVLSKLYALKSDSDTTLIIDINGYLDIVMTDINNFIQLKEKYNMVNTINNYKNQYKANIDKKIEESKRFIEEEITPAIDQLHAQIDDKIELLLAEIKELQREGEDKREELRKKEKELEQTVVLKGLFSCFKIVEQAASFLGPAGAAAGAFLGAANSVTEAFVFGDQTAERQPLSLPAGVTADVRLLKAQVRRAKDIKVTRNNRILDDIAHEIDPHPLLKDVRESIARSRREMMEIRNREGAPGLEERSEEHVAKIKEELKAKEIELKTEKNNDKEGAAEALGAIDTVDRLIRISEVSLDIYSKHRSDRSNLDTMSNAVQQAEENLQNLKQYEGKIYSTITPILNNMAKDLEEVENTLGTKSQVSLDVTKWLVQSSLRDIKLSMRQLTKGFKIEEDLARCIEKLEESMTTLIHVYDRIQDYQQQQNLANYIAAVAAPHGPDNDDQKELEILIRSNLILTQYVTAVDALKQWVFPFTGLYLEKINLPSHLEFNYSNIEDSAAKVKEKIEQIKSQVHEYMTAIQHHDRLINVGLFNSIHVSSHPFFVWRNEHRKTEVRKLLSGEAIFLKADIRGSAPDKDAIKFNLLELNLKVANATRQIEVNDDLKGFK
ncbi:uncharacterized protein LOC108676795, partial [Hyalella azteca]|uniref:Uncharacterized protein LOC108676795 n=1 Tax=Hyalella azteca TaxID=294128 RepID=A0A8B7P5Q9_HYAAZ